MTVLVIVIIYRKSFYVCLPLLASLFLCVRLYLCWCVCLFVCLSVCVSLCLSLSLSLSVAVSRYSSRQLIHLLLKGYYVLATKH